MNDIATFTLQLLLSEFETLDEMRSVGNDDFFGDRIVFEDDYRIVREQLPCVQTAYDDLFHSSRSDILVHELLRKNQVFSEKNNNGEGDKVLFL